ncbi:hypothetical protein IRZ71_24675 [Flavobacterium sp. ANB]|jgi:hypothetical protein|uniref:DUF6520 family protein n=1 Tax=unclassified Flavobacterium TaxID=196869 RepID=UPI0012B792FF|nr:MULTISPECIES: DUF6520 family protein [unclassified Flavobacterium]MBF4519545.1 hypothetical protein [Flavobacterium sp. ANB]MTD72566.1 hypothetical protein [Flavobacterium sp. LC2016-13]
MKRSYVKMLLPTAAFALAIVGAFASNPNGKTTNVSAPVQGYINNPDPCTESVECDNVPSGDICTIQSTNQQVFGLNASGTTCNRVLYKLN